MGGWNWIDKTGWRIGKLEVKKYLGDKKWLCQCDCGNTTIVDSDHLSLDPNKRSTKSCGCLLTSRLTQNSDFFKKIDTEDKAYILGFLASDGTISLNQEKSIYSIRIAVNSIDRDLLIKIKNAIGTRAKIRDYTTTCSLPQGGECQSSFSSLTLHNKKLVLDLEKIGITPRKSLSLDVNYDLIPQKLKRHFWRGLIEGDGSFGIYGKKQILSLTLTTSQNMCISTKKEILKFFPDFKINYYQAIGCSQYTKRFMITSQKDVYDFLSFIYEDATIFLDRKYANFLKIKEIYNNQL